MRDLLAEYKKTLELTESELANVRNAIDPASYYKMLVAAKADLKFVIHRLETGFYRRSPVDKLSKEQREQQTDFIESITFIEDKYFKREINRIQAKKERQQLMILKKIKGELSENHYEMLLLHASGVTYKEIAEMFDMDEKEVSKVIHDNKQYLSEHIQIETRKEKKGRRKNEIR